MSEVYDARRDFSITGRSVLFDTNVWLSIYAYPGKYRSHEQKAYSALLKYIKEGDCQLVTNDYVLAEFANRYMRFEYADAVSNSEDAGEKIPNFKEYRSTKAFEQSMAAVKDTCHFILDDCKYIPVNADLDMRSVCDEACCGHIDFSDIILKNYCHFHGHLVATSDFDFVNCGIDIITCNPRLLKAK